MPLLAWPVLTDYRISDDFHLVGQVNFSDAVRYFYNAPGVGRHDRPIVRLTFALDNLVWCNRAFGYHLTNLLLHTANCILLLLIFERLTGNLTLAFFAAALFGIDPVHHERVAWITARDGAVGTLFFLLSWLTYLWARRFRMASEEGRRSGPDLSRGLLAISLLAFIAGLCSYEGVVTLPFVLMAMELLLSAQPGSWQEKIKQALRTTGPFLVILPFYLAWWFLIFAAKPSEYDLKVSLAGMAHNFYAFHYRLFYGIQHWVGIVYLLMFALVWRERTQWRLILFSLLVIWVGYVPFLPINGFADRFAYFSAIGAVLFIGIGVIGGISSSGKIVPNAAVPALLGLVLFGYYASSDTRIFQSWVEAGRISEAIPAQLKALRASFPPDSTLLFDQIPRMHRGAYVYMNSFDLAVRSKYTEAIPRIYSYPTALESWQSEKLLQHKPAFYFRYLSKQERLVELSGGQ